MQTSEQQLLQQLLMGQQSLVAEVARLRAVIEGRESSRLSDQQRALVEGLQAVYGTEPFTTKELLALLGNPIGDRQRVRHALVQLAGAEINGQRVGIALRRVVDLGGLAGAFRLTAPRREGGCGVWCVDCVAVG